MRSLFLLTVGCSQGLVVGEVDPIDDDRDGVVKDADCDDDDADVFPGAEERCDGKDNDCDELIDGVRPIAGSAEPAYQACEQTATFVQDMKLDLLFVIDNSASMLDAQVEVADGIDDLLQWVIGIDFDTRVGAISTDMDDPLGRGNLVEVGEQRWADGSLTLPLDDWAEQAIVLGANGSGDERPLDTLLAALSPDLNPGFRRPDAHLAVVMLTNEDDQSEATPMQFLDTFRDRAGPRGALIHGLIADGTDAPGCDPVLSETLISVIEATGGLQESICSTDYGPFLSPVGQTSAQRALNTRFPLQSPAQPTTLAVTVQYPGGLVETLDPMSYALGADAHTLVMLGMPPPAGSRLTVRWLAEPGSLE